MGVFVIILTTVLCDSYPWHTRDTSFGSSHVSVHHELQSFLVISVFIIILHGDLVTCNVYCSTQVCLEGDISKQTMINSLSRGKSAYGDLIPWTIAQQVRAVRQTYCIDLIQ